MKNTTISYFSFLEILVKELIQTSLYQYIQNSYSIFGRHTYEDEHLQASGQP